MTNVKLVSITPEAEKLIAYCAKVSNPANQDSDGSKLLAYCIKNSHWSIFEMANICMEINTSRTIARQILRHRSFSFQEFSQRYADVDSLTKDAVVSPARSQDTKNRQNSNDDLSQSTKTWFEDMQRRVWDVSTGAYREALAKGIAKECARVFLPEGQTPSRMYMNGSVRSWIHFLELRTGNGTQLEHQEVANECKKIFIEQLPEISKALGWV